MSYDMRVLWGTVKDEEEWKAGDPYFGLDFPIEYETEQTSAGGNAPEAGCLHESAVGFAILKHLAKEIGGPFPYFFLAYLNEWSNLSTGLIIIDDRWLKRFVEYRDNVLQPWLLQPRYPKFDDETTSARELRYYLFRLRNMVSLINFMELHQDKPNLVISSDVRQWDG